MPRFTSGSFLGLLCALVVGTSCLFVTGCGMGTSAAPNPVQLTVNGQVHGGQQPVAGAQIQLYVAGNGGNGSASSSLLNTAVTSGADGNFSITGDYSCPSSTSQVYLVATQGNPGLGSGGNNPALAMMAALGSCGNLSPTQFIVINEVTTVAAAYALAPFTKDISDIGASSTNSMGLANAFLNAQLIADTTKGQTATLPSNLTTEPGKIYALADAIASCINSDGTTGCSPLFTAATPSGGTAPANTWDALINIVKNPGNNVAGVFTAIGPQPPFATTLAAAPNDWTLSLTVTGGGLNTPDDLGVDSQGNVWVEDHSGILSGFNPQGTPLSSTGFGAANAGDAYGMTIDANDNIWITMSSYGTHNGTHGAIEEFSGVSSGGTLGTTSIFQDGSLYYPFAIATDSNGNLFMANYYVSTGVASNLASFNPTTSTFTSITTSHDIGFSTALAVDDSHGVWLAGASDGDSVEHNDASGNVVFESQCCGISTAVAVDSTGNMWLADKSNTASPTGTDGAMNEFGPDGTELQSFITTGGICHPDSVAIDAAQNVWISNLHSPDGGSKYQSFSELSGSTSSSPGTAISPSTGYGLDAQMLLPYALTVDQSGNVWISATGNNSLVMFFGMATPTKSPTIVTPKAP